MVVEWWQFFCFILFLCSVVSKGVFFDIFVSFYFGFLFCFVVVVVVGLVVFAVVVVVVSWLDFF